MPPHPLELVIEKINTLRVTRASSQHHHAEMFQNHRTACSGCPVHYRRWNQGIGLNAALTTTGSCEWKKVCSVSINKPFATCFFFTPLGQEAGGPFLYRFLLQPSAVIGCLTVQHLTITPALRPTTIRVLIKPQNG